MIQIPFCNSIEEGHFNSFKMAYPFPHIVIDNFYPESILQMSLEEINNLPYEKWKSYYSENSRKRACEDFASIGPVTKEIFDTLTCDRFVEFLQKLTGIHGLTAHESIGKALGNVGFVEQGGYLNIHADYNYVKTVKLWRRLNLLLYLNHNWLEEYGGSLELYNPSMTQKKTVVPIFNRCLIFATSDISFHGHPKRIKHPLGEPRKSISIYYYSKKRGPNTSDRFHSTLYQKL